MKSTSAAGNWMMAKVVCLGVPLILLLLVNNCFAAPATSNEDSIGFVQAPRQAFRNREINPALVDFNSAPVLPAEGGMPVEQPVDLGVFLTYLARHLGMSNRRYITSVDMDRSDQRKRSSYSRYCAFNAVSCFGKRK